MVKKGYICLVCRYLKDIDDGRFLEFGTGTIKNYICHDCLALLKQALNTME